MLRIAIVAHGRFHAFDLGRELAALGHDVHVYSNYPSWAVSRFGLRRNLHTGLWAHGGAERLMGRLMPGALARTEAMRHQWFGRWAARQLAARQWDVVHCWSGVSEEILDDRRITGRRVLMRGSSHIDEQAMLLEQEEQRTGVAVERPSPWMIARERREYDRADRIVVLSEFARKSFERQGVAGDRVSVLPLGVSIDAFRATPAQVAARVERVRSGAPLRVLFVGTLSARKGLLDFTATARSCAELPMTFTLVGPVVPESAPLLADLPANVVVAGRRDQAQLPAVYAEHDVFLFPTIEDGFGMVLTQAVAAGLLLIATTNCAAPDLLADGAQGWVVPIREVEAMADRLRWCHHHREVCAARLGQATATSADRTWTDAAATFAEAARGWVAGPSEDR